VMDGAFDVLIEPVARYEGTVARLEGDAILAFFGAPIAHQGLPRRDLPGETSGRATARLGSDSAT